MKHRELKFRAWSAQRESFVANCYPVGSAEHYGFDLCGIGEDGDDEMQDDGLVLQQFIDLKDKNGKEIFEGDILENPNYPKDEWERCEVKWHQEFARFGLDFYSPHGGEGYTGRTQHIDDFVTRVGCYVIGNIYQNPELLTNGTERPNIQV